VQLLAATFYWLPAPTTWCVITSIVCGRRPLVRFFDGIDRLPHTFDDYSVPVPFIDYLQPYAKKNIVVPFRLITRYRSYAATDYPVVWLLCPFRGLFERCLPCVGGLTRFALFERSDHRTDSIVLYCVFCWYTPQRHYYYILIVHWTIGYCYNVYCDWLPCWLLLVYYCVGGLVIIVISLLYCVLILLRCYYIDWLLCGCAIDCLFIERYLDCYWHSGFCCFIIWCLY